jgi:8-hydroxy-5-deazaflavin:NADPH oxidoreductase
MSVTIIGTGNMARTLAGLAIRAGHSVEVMGRDQGKADDLASLVGASAGKWGAVPTGDIVVTALLAAAVVPTVTEFGNALAGKVVVDISNPFNATFDGLAHETSVAQLAAEAAPSDTHVVKAFNTIFSGVLEKGQPNVFVAGDDREAKASVRAFVESIGLRPLDVGGLSMAHWLEGMGLVAVGLAGNGVDHGNFALGVHEFAG